MSDAEKLLVESRDAGASLALRSYDRHYFLAEVSHAGLLATASVSSYMSDGLGDYFGFMAANWTGWAGEREWMSLEGELVLQAKSDRTGHVYLGFAVLEGSPERTHPS